MALTIAEEQRVRIWIHKQFTTILTEAMQIVALSHIHKMLSRSSTSYDDVKDLFYKLGTEKTLDVYLELITKYGKDNLLEKWAKLLGYGIKENSSSEQSYQLLSINKRAVLCRSIVNYIVKLDKGDRELYFQVALKLLKKYRPELLTDDGNGFNALNFYRDFTDHLTDTKIQEIYNELDLDKQDQNPGLKSYISQEVIDDLDTYKNSEALSSLCKAINTNYKYGHYETVFILIRTIMNYCPPIFVQPNFESILSQHPWKRDDSIKKSLTHIYGVRCLGDIEGHKTYPNCDCRSEEDVAPFIPHLSNLLKFIKTKLVKKA